LCAKNLILISFLTFAAMNFVNFAAPNLVAAEQLMWKNGIAGNLCNSLSAKDEDAIH